MSPEMRKPEIGHKMLNTYEENKPLSVSQENPAFIVMKKHPLEL